MLSHKECVLWANRIVMKLMRYVKDGRLPPVYNGVEDFLYDFWPGMLPWKWPDIREVAACLLENRRWADIHVFFIQNYGFDLTEELRRGIREWERQHREDEGEEGWKNPPRSHVYTIFDRRSKRLLGQADSLADALRGMREARKAGYAADVRKGNPPTKRPGIIVTSSDTDEEFMWMSDGWYREIVRHTAQANQLMRKAVECIGLAKDVPDALKRLRAAGFRVIHRPSRRKPNPGNCYAVIDYGDVKMGFRFGVQCLPDRPLQVPPGVQILVRGMTRQGARALADHLNGEVKRGRYVPRKPVVRLPRENPAFLRGRRGGAFFGVRRSNPTLAVMGANPPTAAGDDIEATWATISYRRPDDPEGRRVVREHEFVDGFVATPLHDGSILLKHPRGMNLWTRR